MTIATAKRRPNNKLRPGRVVQSPEDLYSLVEPMVFSYKPTDRDLHFYLPTSDRPKHGRWLINMGWARVVWWIKSGLIRVAEPNPDYRPPKPRDRVQP